MKKELIAAGAASLAVAAMPVVGVFATTTQNSLTERLEITVDTACQMAATMGAAPAEQGASGWAVSTGADAATTPNFGFTYTGKIMNGGNSGDITGSSIKVTCNDQSGWYVNAAATNATAVLAHSTNGTDIGTATKGTSDGQNNYTDADTSAWGFKLAAADNQTYQPVIVAAYQGIAAVPGSGSATKVVSGPLTDNSTGSTFVTHYEVYISPTQQADTYKGGVTYTLYNPNTN